MYSKLKEIQNNNQEPKTLNTIDIMDCMVQYRSDTTNKKETSSNLSFNNETIVAIQQIDDGSAMLYAKR